MAWIAVVVCGVVAAVGAVWMMQPDLTRVPIDHVNIVPNTDGRDLTVHLTYSSCMEFDRFHFDATTSEVRIAAYAHDLPTCGTDPTTRQVVPVRLGEPLGFRRIVDFTTLRPLTVAS